MDAKFESLMREGLDAATSIAKSLDQLVNEPLVELNPPPPQCPHCGVVNPKVKILPNEEVSGYISDFFISGICLECEKDVFILSNEWNMQPDEKSALMVGTQISERIKKQ